MQEELTSAHRQAKSRQLLLLRDVDLPLASQQIHADLCDAGRNRAALGFLSVAPLMEQRRDQAAQGFTDSRHVQWLHQPPSNNRSASLTNSIAATILRRLLLQQRFEWRLALWPQPRVRVWRAATTSHASPLFRCNCLEASDQHTCDIRIVICPCVSRAEAVLPKRPRKARTHAQLEPPPGPEVCGELRFLENAPLRQVLFEDQMGRVADPGDGHEANARKRRCAIAQANADPAERHPLRLPVRQRPSQDQRELLPVHRSLGSREHLLPEDRHPSFAPGLAGKETLGLTAEKQFVEFDDDAQGRLQSRIVRGRITANRPDEADDGAEGPVHEPNLDPQILSQKDPGPLAKFKHSRHPSEIIGVPLLELALDLRRAVVESTDGSDGLARPAGVLPQNPSIHLHGSVLAAGILSTAVHQQGRLCKRT